MFIRNYVFSMVWMCEYKEIYEFAFNHHHTLFIDMCVIVTVFNYQVSH